MFSLWRRTTTRALALSSQPNLTLDHVGGDWSSRDADGAGGPRGDRAIGVSANCHAAAWLWPGTALIPAKLDGVRPELVYGR